MQVIYLQVRRGHSASDSLKDTCLTHGVLAAMHKHDWESQVNQRNISQAVLQGTTVQGCQNADSFKTGR